MKPEELVMKLILLGFTESDPITPNPHNLRRFSLDDCSIYLSNISGSWFQKIITSHYTRGQTSKLSRNMSSDLMYLRVLKHLGIENE